MMDGVVFGIQVLLFMGGIVQLLENAFAVALAFMFLGYIVGILRE